MTEPVRLSKAEVADLCGSPQRVRQIGFLRLKHAPLTDSDIPRLREIFRYEPDTGIVRWVQTRGKRNCAGKPVGHVAAAGYAFTRFNGTTLYLHRLAFALYNGRWPHGEIDHINGVRDDNRIENLRECSASQNKMNRMPKKRPASGLRGVAPHSNGRWVARIGIEGESRHLGYFDTAEQAHAAYLKAASELHGEFFPTARLAAEADE